MTDNVVLSTNIGTGSTLATDEDASGFHYQKIKIASGIQILMMILLGI